MEIRSKRSRGVSSTVAKFVVEGGVGVVSSGAQVPSRAEDCACVAGGHAIAVAKAIRTIPRVVGLMRIPRWGRREEWCARFGPFSRTTTGVTGIERLDSKRRGSFETCFEGSEIEQRLMRRPLAVDGLELAPGRVTNRRRVAAGDLVVVHLQGAAFDRAARLGSPETQRLATHRIGA